jgi:hypothetical protein
MLGGGSSWWYKPDHSGFAEAQKWFEDVGKPEQYADVVLRAPVAAGMGRWWPLGLGRSS